MSSGYASVQICRRPATARWHDDPSVGIVLEDGNVRVVLGVEVVRAVMDLAQSAEAPAWPDEPSPELCNVTPCACPPARHRVVRVVRSARWD